MLSRTPLSCGRLAGPDDPPKFGQRRRSIGDGAQGEGKKSGITARIIEGQPLAIQTYVLDVYGRGRYPIGSEFLPNNGRVNGIHLGDCTWHMGDV